VAIGLNFLLLAMIVYGYIQSTDLRWGWVLVGVPIVVVNIVYIRHWFTLPDEGATPAGDGDQAPHDGDPEPR
jgi:hypothetical protein